MEKIWTIIQLIANSIIMLGGAGAIIASIIRWMRKPDTDRDERLKRHDEMFDNDNKRLNELEKEQKEMEEAMQIMLQSMLALMTHAIDGNHVEDLEKARNDMQEFLIKRR